VDVWSTAPLERWTPGQLNFILDVLSARWMPGALDARLTKFYFGHLERQLPHLRSVRWTPGVSYSSSVRGQWRRQDGPEACHTVLGRHTETRAPSQVAAFTGKARRLLQGRTTIGGHSTDEPSEGNRSDCEEKSAPSRRAQGSAATHTPAFGHLVTTRELWVLLAEGNEPDHTGVTTNTIVEIP
jgi:hypothetical protein